MQSERMTPQCRRALLALEICGVGIILWHGALFYRDLLGGNFRHIQSHVKILTIAAVMAIQTGYSLRYTHSGTPPLQQRIILGHLLIFLARLNFIFTGGIFSSVFFTRYEQVVFTLFGTVLLFCMLFSMFCVTLDVERLGTAFLNGEARSPVRK